MQVSGRAMQTIAHQQRPDLGTKRSGQGWSDFLGEGRCSQSEGLEKVFSPTPGLHSAGRTVEHHLPTSGLWRGVRV